MSTIKISDFPLQPSQSVDSQIDIIPIIDKDNQINSTITPEGLGSNLTVKYALTSSNIFTTNPSTGGLIGTLQEVTTIGNSTDITINANNITINGDIVSNYMSNVANTVHPITSSLSITSSYYLAPNPSSPPPVKVSSSFAPFPLSKGNSEMWGEQYSPTQGNSINPSQQIGGINGYIWEDSNYGGKFNNDPLLDGIGSGNGKVTDHQRKLIVQSFISPCNWSNNYTDATSQQYGEYAFGGGFGGPSIPDISPFPRYLNMKFTKIDDILDGQIQVHIQIYKQNSDSSIIGELIAKGESYLISSKGVVSIPLQGITIDLNNITSTESNFELIKGHRYYISFEFIRLGGNGNTGLGFYYGSMLGNGTRVLSFRPDFDTTTLPGYSFNGNNPIYSNNFQFVYKNINNGSGSPEFRFGNNIDLTSGGTTGNPSDHKLTLGKLYQQSDGVANFSTFRICCELFNRAI